MSMHEQARASVAIDNIKDAKPGDWIKAEYDGHPFEGEVYTTAPDGERTLLVGPSFVLYLEGEQRGITILSITRPEPKLPTEGGSVILDVTVRDLDGTERVFPILIHDGRPGLHWFSPEGADGLKEWIHDSEIVSWTPGKVVPE